MVDYFAVAVSHALLLLAAWRLLSRDDLDDDSAAPGERSAPRTAPKARGSAVPSLRRNADRTAD